MEWEDQLVYQCLVPLLGQQQKPVVALIGNSNII